jgi:hypothetical protein
MIVDASEALKITETAEAAAQSVKATECCEILEEIYEHIKSRAENKGTQIILGSRYSAYDDRPDNSPEAIKREKLAYRIITQGSTRPTTVGELVIAKLKQQKYEVKIDGYGLHISWKKQRNYPGNINNLR